MKKYLTPRQWIFILFFLVLFLSVLSVGIGAVHISPSDVLMALMGMGENGNHFILMNYRLPRIIVAFLAGAGLAVSGSILQSIIRNPLASPDVIGITKGAGLAAVVVVLLFPKSPTYTLPLAAFTGALVVAAVLYLLAYKNGVKPTTLALVGIALGAICNAGIQYFMIKFPVEINAGLGWLSGSIWGRGWEHVIGLLPWILLLMPLSLVFASKLDILNLGDDVALGLGENVQLSRLLMLAISVALTGASVAAVGTIGFVGLIAPHIARQLVGSKHILLLPAAALIGIALLLVADALGRGLVPPAEIPAGIFTSIIGAPYFLYLLRRQKFRN